MAGEARTILNYMFWKSQDSVVSDSLDAYHQIPKDTEKYWLDAARIEPRPTGWQASFITVTPRPLACQDSKDT